MKGIVKKWSILVGLNSIAPVWLAIVLGHTSFFDLLAMFLGMVTFIAIYSRADLILLRSHKHHLRKSLFWAAILKIFTQIYPAIEVGTGLVSTKFVESTIGVVLFFSTYLKTIVEGVLLSVFVAVLMMLIRLWLYLIQKWKK